MQIWTREHTRQWIHTLESRIQDIDHYLKSTIAWCEDHYIYDNDTVFMLSFITVLWVSNMRDEPISYNELLEILGLENLKSGQDCFYDLGDQFLELDHKELLRKAFNKIKN